MAEYRVIGKSLRKIDAVAKVTGTTKFALADYGITFNLGPASKEVELTLDVEGVEKK